MLLFFEVRSRAWHDVDRNFEVSDDKPSRYWIQLRIGSAIGSYCEQVVVAPRVCAAFRSAAEQPDLLGRESSHEPFKHGL